MWYTYTMEHYSAIKKEWNIAICSNIDGPREYHTKWSKTEKDKYITYMWNLKINTNEFIYKTEIDSQPQKTNLWLPKGKGEGERIN